MNKILFTFLCALAFSQTLSAKNVGAGKCPNFVTYQNKVNDFQGRVENYYRAHPDQRGVTDSSQPGFQLNSHYDLLNQLYTAYRGLKTADTKECASNEAAIDSTMKKITPLIK